MVRHSNKRSRFQVLSEKPSTLVVRLEIPASVKEQTPAIGVPPTEFSVPEQPP